MYTLQLFFLALVFSFIGSIPPGTLNLTVLQLGLSQKVNLAFRFSVAAAIVEYPYAWIAVKFEALITSTPVIVENIKIITALVMFLVGAVSLWSVRKPSKLSKKFENSGFRKGLILGILNPMAIPFWIAITAYLKAQGWIELDKAIDLHAYLLGVTLGALLLLVLLAYLSNKIITYFQPGSWTKYIPGITLVLLGIYSLIGYLF